MKSKLTKRGPGVLKLLGPLLRQAKGARVVTGILEKTAERGGPITNVQLAVIQEFGFGVPERSFLRRTFDRQKQAWLQLSQRLLKLVASGKLDLGAALAMLGERMKSDTKRTITSGAGVPPPNAPSTIAAKGSSRPLVDSGRLLGSIDYEVRLKG